MADRDKLARAKSQALAQYRSIAEMVRDLRNARRTQDWKGIEAAEQRIQEDALSVEVRTAWHVPGADDAKPTEYRILLCTGGPAVQLVGEISEYGNPETAAIEYQDWFTPWTPWRTRSAAAESILLDYARCFYFGES